MISKTCRSCGTMKDIGEFSKASSRSDGKQVNCRDCNAQYRLNHKAEARAYKAVYYEERKEEFKAKSRAYHAENREKCNAYSIAHSLGPASFRLYAGRLTVEEDPKEGLGGTLLVRCALCRDYFTPTFGAVSDRVKALVGEKRGEQRLYCSGECKDLCPIHNAKNTPKHLRPAAKQSRCHQATNRKALIAAQKEKFGTNHCERCGVEGKSLDLHHGILVSENHKESDNMAHQLLLCKDCHLAAHHPNGGCS